MSENDSPWILLKLKNVLFGIINSSVVEMLILPKLTKLATAPDYVRGLINLREKTIAIVDLRKKLDMETAEEEIDSLETLLENREEDHKNWIKELESSTKESREFKLSLDPHKCAFGKWYDNYKTTNILFSNHLKKFDAPHKRIHALGREVIQLVEQGKVDEALARIEETKNSTLVQLLDVFQNARKLLRETHREIVIVLQHEGNFIGVSVDAIESIEHLKEDCFEKLQDFSGQTLEHLIEKTGKTVKEDQIVMLIDTEKLFNISELSEVIQQTPIETEE